MVELIKKKGEEVTGEEVKYHIVITEEGTIYLKGREYFTNDWEDYFPEEDSFKTVMNLLKQGYYLMERKEEKEENIARIPLHKAIETLPENHRLITK